MEGESSPHRDPRLEHAPSLSLINSQTIALADTVVLESGDLGRGMRTASPPSGRADRKGCGGRGGDGCSLSVAPSLQVRFFSINVSPRPSLTQQATGSLRKWPPHRFSYPPERAESATCPSLVESIHTPRNLLDRHGQSPPNKAKATSSDTQKLPSDTSSLSFTPLWVQVPTPPPTLRQ